MDTVMGREHDLRRLSDTDTDDCVLWPYATDGRGYGRLRGSTYTHREVCRWHHGEPPFEAAHAAHRCGVSLCVNPRHLRWVSAADNIADKHMHGTVLRGERHPRAVLSAQQVDEIRRSGMSLRAVASEYGISKSQASRIRTGENWGAA